MPDSEPTLSCLARIQAILTEARHRALQSVNAAMLAAYWHVGREIVEEEQRGEARAGYGERLIRDLSAQLTREFGKGYSISNLKLIRQFYVTYRNRSPSIGYTVSSQLQTGSPSREISPAIAPIPLQNEQFFRSELSWSHYRILMRVDRPEARSFYEVECSKARWSVRELERQIGSLLYERLALSRNTIRRKCSRWQKRAMRSKGPRTWSRTVRAGVYRPAGGG
jgi:hypothetical protein